jgi:transcriptional regulator with XRE-family HTH domain
MSTEKIDYVELSFGERLRIIRKHMGLTQDNFAKILTIDGSYVSSIERGKATPSEAVIKDITTTYRINRNFLDSGELPIFLVQPRKQTSDQEATAPRSRTRMSHDIYFPGNAEEDDQPEHPSGSDMLFMTARVLESNTVYRSALASNIRAFFQAVQGEAEMNDMREKMDRLMSDMAEMKDLIKALSKPEPPEKKQAGNDH